MGPIDQKIVFVTGKGGVGKSTVALALAQEQAKFGKRVLLVEIGNSSYLGDFLDEKEVGSKPISTRLGFDLALWSGESCLREYVLHYLKLERVYDLFFENKVMRALINVAPGLSEVAILGKLTSGVRRVGPEFNYDLVIVDCFATGHALALLRAPVGMLEAIPAGPMGKNCREILAVLIDRNLTKYVLVTLLEELPVVEVLELSESLKGEFNAIPLVIANRVQELPFVNTRKDTNLVLSAIAEQSHKDTSIVQFIDFLRAIFEKQEGYLNQLKNLEVVACLPQVFARNKADLLEVLGGSLRKI